MAYTVADPQNGPVALTFDQMIDEIAKLTKEKSELERELKSLKKPAKAEMKARKLSSYVTPNGSQASLYVTNRCNPDRAEAERRVADPECGMTAEDFTAIFKSNPTDNFKVK